LFRVSNPTVNMWYFIVCHVLKQKDKLNEQLRKQCSKLSKVQNIVIRQHLIKDCLWPNQRVHCKPHLTLSVNEFQNFHIQS
jgi:hypothetical protein